MLSVDSVAGNIFTNTLMAEKYKRARAAGNCERLAVSRMEMDRLRLRRSTDKGTDVGLVMKPGHPLHHGDVLSAGRKFILVEQLPEKVVSVSIRRGNVEKMVKVAALAGHAIGNRHRPISVSQCKVSFPIQADLEIDIFRKILPHGIDLKVKEHVFLPSVEVHSHG